MTPYLYAHENLKAAKRSNGLRFHGYPGRSQPIRLIGVHTTESVFDEMGEDTGAEAVAAFQSRTDRPSSYHRIVDRDSTVVCLPDEATAFGIGGLNSPTLHLSFALRAADWSDPAKAAAARPALERGADVAAEWCRAYDLPLAWLGRSVAFGNGRGLVRHGTADPGRRSDPGLDFPAELFLDLIADRLTRPALTRRISMVIVLEPGSTRQWLCDSTTKRHLGLDEWKGYLAAGVPQLGEAVPATQRAAMLASLIDVTRR